MLLKLTTDKHEASRGLSATAELLVIMQFGIRRAEASRIVSVRIPWTKLTTFECSRINTKQI